MRSFLSGEVKEVVVLMSSGQEGSGEEESGLYSLGQAERL